MSQPWGPARLWTSCCVHGQRSVLLMPVPVGLSLSQNVECPCSLGTSCLPPGTSGLTEVILTLLIPLMHLSASLPGASPVTLKEKLMVESNWGLFQAQQILKRTEKITILLLILGLLVFSSHICNSRQPQGW